MYTLFARTGWGSALVEAQLAYYGLPFTLEQVDDLFQSAPARNKLARLNPVAQIPTLVLPDGTIMTESAAITLHLADVTGSTALVPAPGEATRPQFLRWLVFLVANIYPGFTYADDPARFVDMAAAQAPFRESVDAYNKRLWGMVAGASGTPWCLGERFSALDIYITIMTRWRPRRTWFAENLPQLHDIAAAVEGVPALEEVLRRNIPPDADA